MAGEWIKYRDELWSHPKFIAMTNTLIYGEGNKDFLAMCCGPDVVEKAYPPSNENVTDIALQGVTKLALRSVAMGSLLRVWFAVNAHCKTDGNDAVMRPMALDDLDEIAGFDGFGEAMAVAGWVVADEAADSLIFKNFLDFNDPASIRKKPMTNAERQRLHRERKKEEKEAEKRGRNESNESNAREEKRRINKTVQDSCESSDGQKFTQEDRDLAAEMLKRVREVSPSAKGSPKWPDTIRLMRERDGHSIPQIREMFDFATSDDFWRANVLSPETLRKQWPKLEAKRNTSKPKQKEQAYGANAI